METTTDSGNETLQSDDSSCERTETSPASPSSVCSCGTLHRNDTVPHISANLAPPKIQPHSGVLGEGKVVFRPIAFKPMGMNSAARFNNARERYGSTPILPRAGSHITLFGSSNDLRYGNSNHSLDRKLITPSCTSASSSPPLGFASFSSLALIKGRQNYDSLESIRKSPASTADNRSNRNKTSIYGLLPRVGGCSLLDLTPSPSDSGVSELEAALRDRDSELAYLRQTMEHNEQVIFRVYQEKERIWERELQRMKTVNENRVRASAQKVHKLEQLLMMQTYQLQQDKKRLSADNEQVSRNASEMRQEIEMLRHRLEETEWTLCQKTGEISLLKSQLKDAKSDNTTRDHELLQLRNDYRDVEQKLLQTNDEMNTIHKIVDLKEMEIKCLKGEIHVLKEKLNDSSAKDNYYEIPKAELMCELQEKLSQMTIVGNNKRSGIVEAKQEENNIYSSLPYYYNLESLTSETKGHDYFRSCLSQCPTEIVNVLDRLNRKLKEFEQERIKWLEEKENVLRYQRQLQLSYVQMCHKNKALENEIENLTYYLTGDKANGLMLSEDNLPSENI